MSPTPHFRRLGDELEAAAQRDLARRSRRWSGPAAALAAFGAVILVGFGSWIIASVGEPEEKTPIQSPTSSVVVPPGSSTSALPPTSANFTPGPLPEPVAIELSVVPEKGNRSTTFKISFDATDEVEGVLRVGDRDACAFAQPTSTGECSFRPPDDMVPGTYEIVFKTARITLELLPTDQP